MSKYLTIDLNIFLSLILVMIIIMIDKKQVYKSFSTRLFLGLCVSTILLILLDAVTWLLNGECFGVQYVFIFLFYLVEPVPLIIWLCYLDYYLNQSVDRLKKRWFYAHPFLLITLLMVVNIFTGFIFHIDKGNWYQRGPGIPLVLAVNIVILAYTFFIAICQKNKLETRVFAVIVMFSVIPVLGGILQLLLYGASILWNSVALSVIFVYLFLETQKEIRDYLTGLLNRQQIDDLIASRILDYNKSGGFSLVMLDLDNFKRINDSYGHKEGDRALVRLSEILHSSLKRIDKVARFGGDEFLVLLEEEHEEKILEVIERIRNSLADENCVNFRPYALSITCGYAVYSPEIHGSMQELLNDADQKMYAGKQAKVYDGRECGHK